MKKHLYIILFTISLFHPSLFTQWVQQPLPVNKPITGIKFVNSQTGWACTDYGSQQDTGYIINTTNGGIIWNVQLSVYHLSFTDIDMINSTTGYAAGPQLSTGLVKLFNTTNGGINWSSMNMVPNMYIGDMQFLNKDSAWECGESVGPDVRTTTDGGNTWIVRTTGITQATEKVFFLNYNTGYCAAQSLLRTTNAGLNWQTIGNFTQSVQAIYFLDLNTGWIGVNFKRMYFTSNGGINWTMQNMPNEGNNILDLYFHNELTGYAGTGLNRIFKTTDGGLNWGYQIDTGGSYRMTFINAFTGWACWVGSNIGITHTTNGGGEIIYTGFVNNGTEVPVNFKLYQNYPNPFNPTTTIKLDLPKASEISLVICDILGREHYQVTNEYLKAGSYSFTWDASKYSSGIYFYRLNAGNYTETKKMILVK